MLKSIRHRIIAGLTALLLAWMFWPIEKSASQTVSLADFPVRGAAVSIDAGVILVDGKHLIRLYGVGFYAGRECHYSVWDCIKITRDYMASLLALPGIEVACKMRSVGQGTCLLANDDRLAGYDIAELLLDEGLAYTTVLDMPAYEVAEFNAWKYRKGVWASRKDLPGSGAIPRVELGR